MADVIKKLGHTTKEVDEHLDSTELHIQEGEREKWNKTATAAEENRESIDFATKWNLIPTDYATIADYAASLPVGRHTAFWRNAYDTHITDAPTNAGNLFLEIFKYSNSTIRINAYLSLQTNVSFYSCAFSSGVWGSWYEFAGTEIPRTTTTDMEV